MAGLFEDDPPPPPDGPLLFGDPAAAPEAPRVHAATYRVLARTYRPIDFDDLIGQDTMMRTLRNAFATGRIAHAFMLTGVRGVGKTTTARIIARCLNCTGPGGDGGPTATPCGVCDNCRAILADRHPDVIEMDAASRTGIDDVREIIEATRFRPMQARIKVFIIDEVHMLSVKAFNALLKTLEEPPPHVKFVFATTDLRKVPITVLSRCQRFDLRRVSSIELAARFARIAEREGVRIAPPALQMIARAADGSVRDGLSLLDQAIAQHEGDGEISAEAVSGMLGLADRTLVFDLLEAVLGGRIADALESTARAHEYGLDFTALLQDLLELIHTISRLQAIPALRDSPELPQAERERGGAIAERLSVPDLARAWQMLLKGLAEVETAPDRRAAAEMVLIRLAHLSDAPTPGDLVRRLRDAPAAGAGGTESAGIGGTPRGPGGAAGRLRAAWHGAMAIQAETGVAAAAVQAEAAPRLAAPRFATLRDIAAALAASRADPQLHAHLVHSVHLVRLVPGHIEIRPLPGAPRSLAAQLGAFLLTETGQRWTVAVSTEPGEPTLAEQGEAAELARRNSAEAHPLVQAILAAFPGATLSAVQDSRTDAYGLYDGNDGVALGGTAEQIDLTGENALDMPQFAPEDSDHAEAMPET